MILYGEIENAVFQTRVLVTHNLMLLPHADLIIVMEEGKISEMGTYQELISKKTNFVELIHVFGAENRSEETTPKEGEKTCVLCLFSIFPFHSSFLKYSSVPSLQFLGNIEYSHLRFDYKLK